MAGQQQQILDTIFSMKRKMLRKDDSSDSEDGGLPYLDRKQSLKRKTHYSRSGDPDFLSAPRPSKKRIEHAGYHRYILQRNPPRFDPDGDIVEPDDEYEEEDDLSTVEENPYGDITLENLLAPLTSAADLPNHPALSIAYTSKHLTNLTNEAGALSRKEQITLRHAKNLFTRLQGDSTFAPAALANMVNEPLQESWANGTNGHTTNGISQQASNSEAFGGADAIMADAGQTNGDPPMRAKNESIGDEEKPVTNGSAVNGTTENVHENGEGPPSPTLDNASEADSQANHRMTTRARAQAASTPSPPGSPSSSVNAIHPLFTFTTESLPDRDFGLPPAEAEETRMLLTLYVQKQEEISRITTDLYLGMMQSDRMRQDVFKWSKADGHVGEMSDGEDWYDPEEWGLDQALTKGRDEEEDDTAVAGKKSTRQRRKPDKEDR